MHAENAIAVPSIAGVPTLHFFQAGLQAGEGTVSWPGSRITGEPLIVRHRVGSPPVDGYSETVRVDDRAWYLRNNEGRTIVQFARLSNDPASQTLIAVRDGFEYEYHYNSQPSGPIPYLRQERKTFTIALPARRLGFLAHGAGYVREGGAVLCLGRSGIGKSTFTRLVRSFDAGVQLLSDDRVAVTCEGDFHRAWGTPWPSTEGVVSGVDGMLAAVLLLIRGEGSGVREVGKAEAFRRLLDTVAMPLWDAELMEWALGRLDLLLQSVPVVEAWFEPTAQSAASLIDTVERLR